MFNTRARIRHKGTKETVLRYLINIHVEKNLFPFTIDYNFDHKTSLSKKRCWYSNDCEQFLKCAVPLPQFTK